MSAAENKKLIQDVFAAWARGDGAAFFNILADDVRWTVIGSCPVSRTYTSKQQFFEGATKPLSAKLAGQIQPTVRNVLAEGDQVVVDGQDRLQPGATVEAHGAGPGGASNGGVAPEKASGQNGRPNGSGRPSGGGKSGSDPGTGRVAGSQGFNRHPDVGKQN